MNLTKINKFADFVSIRKYAAWDSDFKLIKQQNSNVFVPKSNEVVLDLGSNITIIYNKKHRKSRVFF